MTPEPVPCPGCGRGKPVYVHVTCFPPERRDYRGEWLFWCTACDRYFEPGQQGLSVYGT